MKVRYSPLAAADLEAISTYLHERSPQGAVRVLEDIREATNLLAERPYIGQETDEPGIRVKISRR